MPAKNSEQSLLLSPTQRVVLAQRLRSLRLQAGWTVAYVAEKVLGYANFPGAVTRIERGRCDCVVPRHLQLMARKYSTTPTALLAVPAHIETFSGSGPVQGDWPLRYALLVDAFSLTLAAVKSRLATNGLNADSALDALNGDGSEVSWSTLHVLNQLTDVHLGWLCLGLQPPMLHDQEGYAEVLTDEAEFGRHDPQGWTPAGTKRAPRYLRR